MRTDVVAKLSTVCRAILLTLLAGHLLLRQTFAHRSLGELPVLFGGSPIGFLQHAYISELCLLLMTPVAVLVFLQRTAADYSAEKHSFRPLKTGMGWPFWLAIGFLIWGAGHAVAALFLPGRTTYLILRQSALGEYALFFVYAVLFFNRREHVRQAMIIAAFTAVMCGVIDAIAENFPTLPMLSFFNREKPWGQATLPVAIIGGTLMIVSLSAWPAQALVFLALALAGWRQGLRLQSVVPISIAGALIVFLVIGIVCAVRGQVNTLKRGILSVALLAFLGWGYLWVRHFTQKVSADEKKEVSAWSAGKYRKLYETYQITDAPNAPGPYAYSTRDGVPVSDPEVYKLNAVFDATGDDISTRNNIWRFLVWRRMLQDSWPTLIQGAGPGHAWWYPALYHTQFNYGEPGLGLDPHNSFLHILYRFGIIGLGLMAALIVTVVLAAFSVLRDKQRFGNVELEGLLLYFFYTIIFACFTVALEGPSYAMPFWFSAGLLYARTRQLQAQRQEEL
jgi:hypothetical protein